MTVMALVQGSPEWIDGRRDMVTGTDIPVLLGLSPYRCEADLADEKLGAVQPEPTLRMRIGSALQDLIGEEYERATGRKVRRFRAMHRHPSLTWAGASLDFGVVGERRIVEAKQSTSRTRFADGLPQDVEAQVQWQLGVTGYPVADVAVLVGDELLDPIEVRADPATFDNLVVVAEDFRRRLAEGGPFSRDAARIRRDHPQDDGTEMTADADLVEAVAALIDVQAAIARHEATEKDLKRAITDRMGNAAILRGPGWRCTWKTSKAPVVTNWQALATGLLTTVPETEREALVGLHQTVGKAQRPLRVWLDKETE